MDRNRHHEALAFADDTWSDLRIHTHDVVSNLCCGIASMIQSAWNKAMSAFQLRSFLLAMSLVAAAGLATETVHAQEPSAVEPITADPAAMAPEVPDSGDSAASQTSFFDRVNEQLAPVNAWFGEVNQTIGSVIFYEVPLVPGTPPRTVPLAVLLLVTGAAYFTVRMGFINLTGFTHAIKVVSGKYSDGSSQGDVSHFQALTTALSATVGLGNIAGVSTAIALGGPGAAFWMILAGFMGMSSKFVECTLGQKYREIRPDGHVMGGAMYYLSRGLAELGLGPLGKVLGVAFAVLCVGGSFAGGNSYQVKGSLDAVSQTVPFFGDYPWVYGLIMLVITAVVIIGGIKRIASTADKIVPVMCGVYVLGGLLIILKNYSAVPAAFNSIFASAFSAEAFRGGFFGVLIMGFKRAAFSNEAGVGSAAIAHAAAKCKYPIREGIVALLEPFVDTILVCTMTALVIIITGAYDYRDPSLSAEFRQHYDIEKLAADGSDETDKVAVRGAALTSAAMDGEIPGFKYVLAFATFMFAYSTMISWSYYGERCWAFLFGENQSIIYKLIFLAFTFLGSVVSAQNVMDFGDLMIFGMMIPNMVGLFLLSGIVRRDLQHYMSLLQKGSFDQPADPAAASDESA